MFIFMVNMNFFWNQGKKVLAEFRERKKVSFVKMSIMLFSVCFFVARGFGSVSLFRSSKKAVGYK